MTTVAHKSLHFVHGRHNNNKQNRKLKEANIRMRHLSRSFKLFFNYIYLYLWGSFCVEECVFKGHSICGLPLSSVPTLNMVYSNCHLFVCLDTIQHIMAMDLYSAPVNSKNTLPFQLSSTVMLRSNLSPADLTL